MSSSYQLSSFLQEADFCGHVSKYWDNSRVLSCLYDSFRVVVLSLGKIITYCEMFQLRVGLTTYATAKLLESTGRGGFACVQGE
jgi:hypothetical protein